MRIKLSTGEEIEIRFEHWHDPTVPRRSWSTVAYVFDGSERDKLLVSGSSRLHPNDNFDKIAGRKIALRRALEHFERPLRKEIWSALIKSGVAISPDQKNAARLFKRLKKIYGGEEHEIQKPVE